MRAELPTSMLIRFSLAQTTNALLSGAYLEPVTLCHRRTTAAPVNFAGCAWYACIRRGRHANLPDCGDISPAQPGPLPDA